MCSKLMSHHIQITNKHTNAQGVYTTQTISLPHGKYITHR